MFATFIYEKVAERLLRHFIGTDENEGIRASAEHGARRIRALKSLHATADCRSESQ
jgi:hypothetical protein